MANNISWGTCSCVSSSERLALCVSACPSLWPLGAFVLLHGTHHLCWIISSLSLFYFCLPLCLLRWPVFSQLLYRFLDLHKTCIQETFNKYLLIDSFNQVCSSRVAQFNYSTWQSALSWLIDLLPRELNIGFTAHIWKYRLDCWTSCKYIPPGLSGVSFSTVQKPTRLMWREASR